MKLLVRRVMQNNNEGFGRTDGIYGNTDEWSKWTVKTCLVDQFNCTVYVCSRQSWKARGVEEENDNKNERTYPPRGNPFLRSGII